MNKNKDSYYVIAILLSIWLGAIGSWVVFSNHHLSRELEQTKNEYRGYQQGVKDSQ